jgi:hypothetical protein
VAVRTLQITISGKHSSIQTFRHLFHLVSRLQPYGVLRGAAPPQRAPCRGEEVKQLSIASHLRGRESVSWDNVLCFFFIPPPRALPGDSGCRGNRNGRRFLPPEPLIPGLPGGTRPDEFRLRWYSSGYIHPASTEEEEAPAQAGFYRRFVAGVLRHGCKERDPARRPATP